MIVGFGRDFLFLVLIVSGWGWFALICFCCMLDFRGGRVCMLCLFVCGLLLSWLLCFLFAVVGGSVGCIMW